MDYELLDSGEGRKLERFGDIVLSRPSSAALWSPQLKKEVWSSADGHFTREGGLRWTTKAKMPQEWTIDVEDIHFKLKRTDFGHLGIFPEQAFFWHWIQKFLQDKPQARVLNLFAYSGGSTLAAAKAKAKVTHVDAARGMVEWAKENSRLNGLEKAKISWIVDDARKYIQREIRRKERYDAIILDPPSFGRGKSGEVFKIEKELVNLIEQTASLLSDTPLFFLFTCHTMGVTPLIMEQLLKSHLPKGILESGEMVLKGKEGVFQIPSGNFALWRF